MKADDRTLLLDLENLGSVRRRPRPLRARLEALLAAAGEHHHAVAAYAVREGEADPASSVLAELRIAPLRVCPGPDAAELALLAHARHVHAEGGRVFVVGSGDGRFAELATLGRVELLVWEGQPVAAKLVDRAHRVRRLPQPTGMLVEDHATPALDPTAGPSTEPKPAVAPSRGRGSALGERLLAALVTGLAIAAGHRMLDALLPHRRK